MRSRRTRASFGVALALANHLQRRLKRKRSIVSSESTPQKTFRKVRRHDVQLLDLEVASKKSRAVVAEL